MSKLFDFSEALHRLNEGSRVSRVEWAPKGIWVGVRPPCCGSVMELPYLYMRTISGHEVPWQPGPIDLFALDWMDFDR